MINGEIRQQKQTDLTCNDLYGYVSIDCIDIILTLY